MKVAAIILAAGSGSRFAGKTHKLLTPIGGVPIVVRAVTAALDAGFRDVIVVSGAVPLASTMEGSGVAQRIVLVDNPRWKEGLAGSLRAGLEVAAERGHDHAVIGLGDMPAVTAEDWAAVARETSTPIAVARWSQGRRSPPVRIHSSLWPQLPVSGDAGVRALWETEPTLATDIPRPGTGHDVDTEEDLAAV